MQQQLASTIKFTAEYDSKFNYSLFPQLVKVNNGNYLLEMVKLSWMVFEIWLYDFITLLHKNGHRKFVQF